MNIKGQYLFIAILGTFLSQSVSAQNYMTLPKGVRMFFARNVQSDVESSYNKSASETPYKYEINADIENLETLDDERVQGVLEVFKDYPDAYNLISLGRYKLEASAQVEVNAYAFAYGINNRLTAYIGLPIYDAKVKLDYRTVKKSTGAEVSDALIQEYGDDYAQALGQVVDQIYSIDAGVIQSAFVNNLGYQELGDWQGSGLGDLEFGLFYNFLRESKYGAYAKLGGVAPTGYVDNPDIIQDIGFGDGQWDSYLEVGAAYRVLPKLFLEAETRYTYQFSSEKRLRVPLSADIPLSEETATFEEKLGNRYDTYLRATINATDWLSIEPAMIFTYTEKAKYDSSNSSANRILALNTESNSRSFRVDAKITTANLYLMNKFPIPTQLTFSAQNMIEGKNVAKTDLVEFELRMFF